MINITFKIPDKKTANKIIAVMRELGIEPEEQEMTLADFEQYLYNGDENTKTAERLAVLRKEKKLTLRKLSEMTDIPYRHISEMEHGKRTIGKNNAKKLAKSLGADYRFLL